LGLTQTQPEATPLATASTDTGAVSASDLVQKKDLNDEILAQNGADNLKSTKVDTSAKRELNNELLNVNKNEILSHPSTLPNTSAKEPLNREILSTDKSGLLHHNSDYDSELRRENETSIPLQSNQGPQTSRGVDFDSPSLSSRPEFQKLPYTPKDNIIQNDASVLPPQMSSGVSNLSMNTTGLATQGVTHANVAPLHKEVIQKDVVVHERIHPVQKEEIQPVIYREREQLDVKQVTQMMHETQIQPTLVQRAELPAERREAIIERGAPIAENYIAPSREVDATTRTQVVHAPIVEEVIRKTVVQEVQPVLERDVYTPVAVQTTQPIYEKIVEAPIVHREVREVRELGTRSSTGYVQQEVVSGRRLSASHNDQLAMQQQQMYQQGGQMSYDEQLAMQQQYQQGGQMMSNRRLSASYNDQIALQQQQLQQQQQQLQYQQGAQMMSDRRLSAGYDQSLMTRDELAGLNSLPTGQVLPNVASSRPAWAYLPADHAEKRPDFVGTSSQFALAQGGLNMAPGTLQKGLYNPYIAQQAAPSQALNNPAAPLNYRRQ